MHYMGTEAEYQIYQSGLERDPETRGHVSEKVIRNLLLTPRYLPEGLYSTNTASALLSGFLSNGDRLYPECASDTIVELCTSERKGALSTMLCDQRGIQVLQQVSRNVNESGDIADHFHIEDIPYYILRRTVNTRKLTTGHHINLPVPRHNFEINSADVAPVYVAMIGGIPFFGGGAVDVDGEFTMFQKSCQVKEYCMPETTMPRKPLINLRYEPLADPYRYQRLHIVGNDILHSPWATWLRLGMLEMVTELCEKDRNSARALAGKLPARLDHAIETFSDDPYFTETTTGYDGKQYTVLDYFDIIVDMLSDSVEEGILSVTGENAERAVVLQELDWARDMNRNNPDALKQLVDWRYRLEFLEGARERGKTLMQLAQIDVSVDDISGRKLPERYQSVIRHYGFERLASVFKVPIETLEERAGDLHYVEPGGRAELRAAHVFNTRSEDPSAYMRVDWGIWRIDDETYAEVDHPSSSTMRIEHHRPSIIRRRVEESATQLIIDDLF